MKKEFIPEPLKIKADLEGFSLKMIQEHFKLYQGYVKKTNEVQKKIEAADKSEANAVYSEIAELKRQETFAVNGMKLHEIYFSHLEDNPSANSEKTDQPQSETLEMINKDFGSLELWKEDIMAASIGARGWAILAFDFKDNRLHNYSSDAHNVGAVWGAIPLIALDVYEHAYFMDYGVNRKDYLNAFFKNLNWNSVNKIIKYFELDKKHNQTA